MTRLTKAQWWRQRQLKTFKEHPQRGILKLATFKTLFTFQTIENNNLNVNSDPSMKSEVGQHSQFMQYFKINQRQHQYRDLDILVVTLPSSRLLFIHTVDLSLKLSLSLPMSLSLPLSLSFFQSNHRHYRYLDLDIVVGTLPNSRLLFIKIPPDQPTSLSSCSWGWRWWWWWWWWWWWEDEVKRWGGSVIRGVEADEGAVARCSSASSWRGLWPDARQIMHQLCHVHYIT